MQILTLREGKRVHIVNFSRHGRLSVLRHSRIKPADRGKNIPHNRTSVPGYVGRRESKPCRPDWDREIEGVANTKTWLKPEAEAFPAVRLCKTTRHSSRIRRLSWAKEGLHDRFRACFLVSPVANSIRYGFLSNHLGREENITVPAEGEAHKVRGK